MGNMAQLAGLLEDRDMADELELGELYREMGQPSNDRDREFAWPFCRGSCE